MDKKDETEKTVSTTKKRNKQKLVVMIFASLILLLLAFYIGTQTWYLWPFSAPDPEQVQLAKETVYVTKDGDKYHRQSCQYLSNTTPSQLTKLEAVEKGYQPCKICFPDS